MDQPCPVVLAIKELYGAHDYEDTSKFVTLPTIHGGVECQLSIDYVLFYMTKQKMEFARFELAAKKLLATNSNPLNIESNVDGLPELYKKYIAGYQGYFGKKSNQICEIIAKESLGHLYRTFTYACDILAILEEMCSRGENPSGWSLPSVTIDLQSVSTEHLIAETNLLITYANSIVVNGIKTQQHIEKVTAVPVDVFEFPTPDTTPADYIESARRLLNVDMKIADIAVKVEESHAIAIKKLAQVVEVEQKIIDSM